MAEPLIEFQDVSKSFDTRQILDRVCLEIFAGQTTTIIGKSGTGKSVLLKHIIGLLQPDEGTIRFHGTPIHAMSRRQWDDYRSQISFCFQNNALFDSLTVFDNIALPLSKTTRLPKSEIKARVNARIEQMELTDVPDKYPADLSGGMQKRVALARALITDPQIVLFDEPTTGQDPIRKNAILSMIAQYQKKFGFTTIMVSHELPDVFFISDRILVLYDRKIIFQGNYLDLQNFDHPMVDEFIKSLEGVQDELTGLHSRQGFTNRYEQEMEQKDAHEGFAVIVFSVENIETLAEHCGHTVAQGIIQALGSHINHHFSHRGISNRSGQYRFISILPTTGTSEAEELLAVLGAEIRQVGMGPSLTVAPGECTLNDDYCDLAIMAGIAEGTPAEDIEKTSQKAIDGQQVIAHLAYQKKR